MQALKSSRPASGAEHQFSHLWDMQNHTHNGHAPSHGFKVGIGTLASIALHKALLGLDQREFCVDTALRRWPEPAGLDARIAEVLGPGELGELGRREMRAKYVERRELRPVLEQLRDSWPAVRERLAEHLPSFVEARRMLAEAGCPTEPEQIGITRERLRRSYEQAWFIRRRFTVLDFTAMWGLTDTMLDRLFAGDGHWFGAAVTAGSKRR
jgi:glycerol-1-phosphate dehydrogenase [NAD(P)+]